MEKKRTDWKPDKIGKACMADADCDVPYVKLPIADPGDAQVVVSYNGAYVASVIATDVEHLVHEVEEIAHHSAEALRREFGGMKVAN